MSDGSTESKLHRHESKCYYLRLFFAEFVGTFLLLAFVNGSAAAAILSAGPRGQPSALYMCIGSGCGLAIAVICTYKISGGHVNPALSLAFFAIKKINFKTFVLYSIAQYIGAFVGSMCVFGLYDDQIRHFDGGNETYYKFSTVTAGIFATFPAQNSSLLTCAFDQVFGTMLLLFGVLAITDETNLGMPPSSQPVALGILLTAVLLGFGLNCGAALNPARDLSPRITAAICGWGLSVFSVHNYMWFWIPIVCPYIGAVLGGLLYHLTLGSIRRGSASSFSRMTDNG